MGFGIAFSGFAWIAAGAIQLAIDGGDAVSIAWQMLPYLLLTFGEVLVSATGARVRVQPGAAVHEGRDHGVLVSVGHGRQPVGAAGQCDACATRR